MKIGNICKGSLNLKFSPPVLEGINFRGHIWVCATCVLSHFSRVRLFVTLWTEAHQAPLPVGFSREEYWSALPCPPPGVFPPRDGTRVSCGSCIDSRALYTSATWKALMFWVNITKYHIFFWGGACGNSGNPWCLFLDVFSLYFDQL